MQLLEAFPQLHVAQIEKKLEEILQHVKQAQRQEENIPRNPAGSPYVEAKDADSEDNKRVLQLRRNVPTDTTKKELRTIYYKAKDNAAQLNAMIGLIDLFDPLEDSPSEMMELCKFGIKLAESMNSSRFKAYFTAQKAYFVSCDFIDTDMKMFFDIRASNLVGIPFVTEPQRQETLSRLRHFQEEYNSLFDEALSLLVKSNDAEMMGEVY